MRPPEPTDTSRLKAANIRLQFAEQTNIRQQRLIDANSKPFLEKIAELRKALEASEADLTAEKSKRRRTRKAPPVDDTTALISLCTLHVLELAERLQEAGVDTLPSQQILDLGDLSAPLVEAQAKFVAIRTPEPAPEPEPVPTKRRRTRKAPVSE